MLGGGGSWGLVMIDERGGALRNGFWGGDFA